MRNDHDENQSEHINYQASISTTNQATDQLSDEDHSCYLIYFWIFYTCKDDKINISDLM